MHKEQSLTRKIKRGHLTTKKNETLNTFEIWRKTKRGRQQMIHSHRLNE